MPNDERENREIRQRRRKAVRTAVVLAIIVAAVYLGFIGRGILNYLT